VRRLPDDGELLSALPGAHLASDDKSGVHTEPDTKGDVALFPELGVEHAHLVEDAETGVHGTLRVVLVRAGVAEIDDHTIADVLSRVTAEPLDRPSNRVLVATDHLAEVLGVERLRQQGRADEVAEHDRHVTALGSVARAGRRDRHLVLEPATATAAEPRSRRDLQPAMQATRAAHGGPPWLRRTASS
jgi:hypothetical protein